MANSKNCWSAHHACPGYFWSDLAANLSRLNQKFQTLSAPMIPRQVKASKQTPPTYIEDMANEKATLLPPGEAGDGMGEPTPHEFPVNLYIIQHNHSRFRCAQEKEDILCLSPDTSFDELLEAINDSIRTLVPGPMYWGFVNSVKLKVGNEAELGNPEVVVRERNCRAVMLLLQQIMSNKEQPYLTVHLDAIPEKRKDYGESCWPWTWP